MTDKSIKLYPPKTDFYQSTAQSQDGMTAALNKPDTGASLYRDLGGLEPCL